MSWNKSLTAFADQAADDLTQEQREMAAYALNQIISRSPVSSGAYRGNHRVTVNSENHSYDLTHVDKTGQMTLTEGLRIIGQVRQPFGRIVIQNNLPYGEALEDGYSKQAPAGVYSVATESTAERFK